MAMPFGSVFTANKRRIMKNRIVIVKELLTAYVEVESEDDESAIENVKAMIDSGEVVVARDCEEVSRTFEIGMAREEIEARIADAGVLLP